MALRFNDIIDSWDSSKASVEPTLLVFAVNNPRADEGSQTLVDGDFLFASSAVVTGMIQHA